jgi:uncharacterized protein (TIGR00255 family)
MTAPLASMTGFARSDAAEAAIAVSQGVWFWEVRSVNGRGLELRLRLPAGLDDLEPALRVAAGRVLRRGTVQASLAVPAVARTTLRLNLAWLETLIGTAQQYAAQLPGAPPPRIDTLMGMSGVIVSEQPGEGAVAVERGAVVAGFEAALERLVAARTAEGERLGAAVTGLLDQFAGLLDCAAAAAAGQAEARRSKLMKSVGDLLQGTSAVPEERLAQEVVLLAARSDVREEIDRLSSHLAGARNLIERGGPVGRELEFLVQEFGREINTLCSKSGELELTSAGLQMKAVMEQIREQVQNLE